MSDPTESTTDNNSEVVTKPAVAVTQPNPQSAASKARANTPAPVAPVTRVPLPEMIIKQPEVPADPFFQAFDDMLIRTMKTAPKALNDIVTFLQEYVVKMGPKEENAGIPAADYQLEFFNALKNVIDKSLPSDFNKTWNVVLSFFWRYRDGALGNAYVHRFASFWNVGDVRLDYFQRICNLCVVSADPKERSRVTRLVDVPKTAREGFTPAGVQNLHQFYKV